MNKEYFLKLNFSLAIQIGWALFWRTNVISFILLFIIDIILLAVKTANNIEEIRAWNNIYIVIVISFIATTFACYQFFKSSRMGSLKLLIMEKAHYQEMVSKSNLSKSEK